MAGHIRAAPGATLDAFLVVRRGHLAESTLRGDAGRSLAFDLRHEHGEVELSGSDALAAAATLSPALNPQGASGAIAADAVRSIDARGGPERYLELAGRWLGQATRRHAPPLTRWDAAAPIPASGLFALTDVQRLALEMVLHEDAERRALDGELADLEQAWRDAEEIAAIADNLVLPRAVEAAWERLRPRVRP